MKLLTGKRLKPLLVSPLIFSLVITALVTPPLKAQSKTPATHVNDNAEVLSDPIKEQLENILSNLQLRSGINFYILTTPNTGGLDIYDFSFGYAKDWDVGLRTSTNKSLLLVISVGDKLSLTQLSKGMSKQLPEGALGELSQRLRQPLNSGKLSEGLLESVQQLVVEIAGKNGFSTEGMDQAPPKRIAAAEPSISPAESPAVTIAAKPNDAAASRPAAGNSKTKNTPEDDEAESEAVSIMQTHPYATRVDELKDFITTHPESKSKGRALELLVSSRAALADEKLRAADRTGGIEQFMKAIADAPADASEKLFNGVIAQIPFNLYLRDESTQAFIAAKAIESKFGGDAKHLLALSGFYLRIERGDEATRTAEQAVKLAPDMAAAYDALGLALHISLRLDEAAAAYKRALELDPKSTMARRSLADLSRSTGKPAEALAAYREQLAIDPTDKGARSGMVLALYEAGETEAADKELAAVLKDNPRSVMLLAGAGYWFIAHNNSKRGLQLAKQAADIEPRYTWGQIALARGLIADKSPEYAESCLRFARQYGRFPTLEYELANALAAMGLYEEAAQALSDAFTVKDGVIETRLAGRIPARNESFIELLAPERRASIFQSTAADTEANARMLKALLTFSTLTEVPGNTKIDEAAAVAAARDFAAGDDDMRAYRQLYAAGRLLQHGVGFAAAQELADAARNGVDAALSTPAATIAVQADELREIRAKAIASGGTPDLPDAPKNALAKIMRGRIEDFSGWALFNQDKPAEAVERLRLAVGIIPEQTPLWRVSVWHLGTALEQNGNTEEALNY
ncbi:MAG TPA: TPM domain-containing protein, partial [Pyrinomonadaceae bacterium]|nr:TPM domain-containing protein [Pyrinomonadaceae bacterium]